jgi:hypothetical protein
VHHLGQSAAVGNGGRGGDRVVLEHEQSESIEQGHNF